MNNFWTRAVTGAVFVTVMIGCIWWSFWSMAGLFLVISILGLWEFYSLLENANHHPQKVLGILTGILIFLFPLNHYIPYILPLIIFGLFFIELFRKFENPFTNIAYTILGFIYISIPFTFLGYGTAYFRETSLGISESYFPNLLLGFFFLVWANDTFAYLVGISIGKHRLFERHSPKKSWEGFIGGIICAQGIAYIISIYFTELAPIHWLVVALIVSVFGTMGDLVESMFKRSLGLKDSGNILPGHGGILDRFDAVLLSAPFVVTYLMLIR